MTTEQRFWDKVNKTPSCWLWTGSTNGQGYGLVRVGSRWNMAHRVAYEMLVGPIPATLTLDHLCRTRPCVYPEHLEPVTNTINLLRGKGFAAINARKTQCKKGHPFDMFNTYTAPDGSRECRICRSERRPQ